MIRVSALALVALCLAPARASATCLGLETPRWSAHEDVVALLNPMGVEHNLRIGLCVPLYRSTDAVLSANHLEIGATSYVSPVYAIGGGYAQVSPATLAFVRLELELEIYWRVGGYTNHANRVDEATTLAGVSIDHDLGGL